MTYEEFHKLCRVRGELINKKFADQLTRRERRQLRTLTKITRRFDYSLYSALSEAITHQCDELILSEIFVS